MFATETNKDGVILEQNITATKKIFKEEIEKAANKIVKLESDCWVNTKILEDDIFVMLTSDGAESIKFKYEGTLNEEGVEYLSVSIDFASEDCKKQSIYFEDGGIKYCLSKNIDFDDESIFYLCEINSLNIIYLDIIKIKYIKAFCKFFNL